MKKRVLILLVVMLLTVSGAMAAESKYSKYYFSLGVNLSKSDYVYHGESGTEGIFPKDPDKTGGIAMGAEFRLNLGYFRLDINGDFSVLTPQFLYFNGMSDVGVSIDIKDVVGIGFGLGPSMTFMFFSDGRTPIYIDTDDDYSTKEASIFYAWVHSHFNYRITLDAIVGPVMRVGLAYTFPTKFNLELFKIGELNPFKKGNIDSGRLAVCLQMRLF